MTDDKRARLIEASAELLTLKRQRREAEQAFYEKAETLPEAKALTEAEEALNKACQELGEYEVFQDIQARFSALLDEVNQLTIEVDPSATEAFEMTMQAAEKAGFDTSSFPSFEDALEHSSTLRAKYEQDLRELDQAAETIPTTG